METYFEMVKTLKILLRLKGSMGMQTTPSMFESDIAALFQALAPNTGHASLCFKPEKCECLQR